MREQQDLYLEIKRIEENQEKIKEQTIKLTAISLMMLLTIYLGTFCFLINIIN